METAWHGGRQQPCHLRTDKVPLRTRGEPSDTGEGRQRKTEGQTDTPSRGPSAARKLLLSSSSKTDQPRPKTGLKNKEK